MSEENGSRPETGDSSAQNRTRRQYIALAGITGVSALAGCTGDSGNGNGGENGTDGENGNGSENGTDGGTVDNGPSENVEMTVASLFNESHAISQGALQFKEDIEDETDGRISVEVSLGGEYGSQTEISELLSQGGIEGAAMGLGPFDQYASEYFFIQTPFAVRDYDHIRAIAEHDVFQPAYDNLIEQGNQRMVGNMFYRGTRHTYTTEDWGPVRTVEDVQDMPTRITPWETWQGTWNEVGVDARSIDLSEVYSAAEQGVIEAFEGPFEQTRSSSQYEVCSYVNLTENLTSVGGFYMSEPFFQDLHEDDQDLMLDLWTDASDHVTELAEETESEHLDFFREQGLEIIEDTNPDEFNEAARPALEGYYSDRWASDYETIMSIEQ